MMTTPSLTVYGTSWCGDCHRAQRFLRSVGIPYQWIDIDKDREAESFVMKTNHGMRSVPTLVFQDGAVLVEPSTKELAHKLGVELTPSAP